MTTSTRTSIALAWRSLSLHARGWLAAVFASVATVATAATATTATAQAPPGGLYLGYYHEDPASNPEDPFPGALFLVLPFRDGPFAGTMYFTHLGCQPLSVGRIAGQKSQRSLSGRWTGQVDYSIQAGSFSGIYDEPNRRYAGIYTVDRGKQYVDRPSCVQYYIAPVGTWELFAVATSVPESFAVYITGDEISWSPVEGAAAVLVAVVDRGRANAGETATAVRWQAYLMTGPMAFDATHSGVALTENDIVTVTAFDASRRRIAFGSKVNAR